MRNPSVIDSKRYNRLTIVILTLLSALPLLILIYIVTRNWVNIPYIDEWDLSSIFDHYIKGSLNFQIIAAQHNENRFLFVRLIMLGIGVLKEYDVRFIMTFSIVFTFLTSINLFSLIKHTLDYNIKIKLSIYTLTNLIVFSLVQWFNYLLGIQISVFMIPLFLTTGLVVNKSSLPLHRKVLINCLLALLATYSFANGMILWLLLIPPDIFTMKSYLKSSSAKGARIYYSIIWYVIIAFLSVFRYFRNWYKPIGSPSLSEIFRSPLDATLYFFGWLGNPLLLGDTSLIRLYKPAIGLVLFALFFMAIIYIYKGKSIHKAYPWIIIGLYASISGIGITLGRSGLGQQQGSALRYTTISSYLIIALIVLVTLSFSINKTQKKRKHKFVCSFLLIAIFLFMNVNANISSLDDIAIHHEGLINGRLALQLHKVVIDKRKLTYLYPDVSRLLKRFNELRRAGFIEIETIDSLKSNEIKDRGRRGEFGFFDSCLRLNSNLIRVRGWARSGTKPFPADAVIFGYFNDEFRFIPFAFAKTGIQRDDVSRSLNKKSLMFSGFDEIIDTHTFPESHKSIRAVAVDIENNGLYLLHGSYHIR